MSQERFQQINKLRRQVRKLDHIIEQRTSLVEKLGYAEEESKHDHLTLFRTVHAKDRVETSLPRLESKRKRLSNSMEWIAHQGVMGLMTEGRINNAILFDDTAPVVRPPRVVTEEALPATEPSTEPVALPSQAVEPTEPTHPAQPEPTVDKPKQKEKLKTPNKQETVTLPFRTGHVETKKTQGALVIRKLIQRPKTLGQLCIETLGEDSPENRKRMSSHVIPDAKRIAEQNGHFVAKFIKDKETGYRLKKQKVKRSTPLKPDVSPTAPSNAISHKRGYEKDALIDIYTKGSFVVELPNGKKAEIPGGQSAAIVDLVNAGVDERDAIIARMYKISSAESRKKAIDRLSVGVNTLNTRLAPYNYKLIHPTREELRKGTPYKYSWEKIKKEQNTALEESEERSGFTSYESAILAHQLSEPDVVAEFEEKVILPLDNKLSLEIQKASGNRKPPANRNEMQQLRNNILAKMQKIVEEDKINDIDQNCSDSTRTLLTYFLELEDKLPEAFKILKTHLEKSRGLKRIVIDNGKIYHVAFGDQETPTPTGRSRWGHDRTVKTEDTQPPTPIEPTEPTEETVTESVLVFDAATTAPETVKPPDELTTSKPEKTKKEVLKKTYPDLYEKDNEFITHMQEAMTATLKQFPFLKVDASHSINKRLVMGAVNVRAAFLNKLDGKYIEISGSESKPLITPNSILIINYIKDNFPDLNFNPSANKQLRAYAKILIEELIESQKTKNGGK